jgi:trypsin
VNYLLHFLLASLSNNITVRGSRDLVSTNIQKIIGGSNAPFGAYPWFVGAGGCGASLVSSEFILTAAHCSDFIYKVHVGLVCKFGNNCDQKKESFLVAEKFQHPLYNENSLAYDFALMKLDSQSTITPVELDFGDYSPNYDNEKYLWTAGFGMADGYYLPKRLKHVKVKYVDETTCSSIYTTLGYEFDEDSMMCAADYGKDSCQGDSGGPLYDKQNNKLVGVVSWGDGCARPGIPGVYSKISSVADWIKKTICQNSSTDYPSFCIFEPTKSPLPTPAPTISPTLTPCLDGEMDVQFHLTLDNFPEDNSWELISGGNLIETVVSYTEPHSSHIYRWCLVEKDCYTLSIVDDYGDGFLFGGYTLSVDSNTIMSYDDNLFGDSVQFGYCTLHPSVAPTMSQSPSTSHSPSVVPTTAPSEVKCMENEMKVIFLLKLDFYPEDTSFSFFINHGDVIASVSDYTVKYGDYRYSWCVPKMYCYTFSVEDSYGDGFFDDTGYELYVDGDIIMSYDSCCDKNGESIILGDCSVMGSSSPSISPSSPPTISCEENTSLISLEIFTDRFPNEISWTLTDANLQMIGKDHYNFSDDFKLFKYDWCLLQEADYTFTIKDTYGDGLIEGGYYKLACDSIEMIKSDSLPYSINEHKFTVPRSIPTQQPIQLPTNSPIKMRPKSQKLPKSSHTSKSAKKPSSKSKPTQKPSVQKSKSTKSAVQSLNETTSKSTKRKDKNIGNIFLMNLQ